MYITADRFRDMPDPTIAFQGYREQYHTRFSEFDDTGYCFEKNGQSLVIYAFSRDDYLKFRIVHPANGVKNKISPSAIEHLLSFIVSEYVSMIHSSPAYRLRYITGDFKVSIEE